MSAQRKRILREGGRELLWNENTGNIKMLIYKLDFFFILCTADLICQISRGSFLESKSTLHFLFHFLEFIILFFFFDFFFRV